LFQPPVEVVELQLEESEFEINLEDEIPFETVVNTFQGNEKPRELHTDKKIQIHTLTEKPKKKSGKGRNELVGESNPENVNVDSWFFRQFGRFFDDKDTTPMSDENTKM
jgi:hypothetical protein